MKNKTLEERKKGHDELAKRFPNKVFVILEKIQSDPGKEIIHKLILSEEISLENLYIQFNKDILKNASQDPLIQIKIYTE